MSFLSWLLSMPELEEPSLPTAWLALKMGAEMDSNKNNVNDWLVDLFSW